MSDTSTSPITNVADTAFWVAVARAHESERPDALFHDPYASCLQASGHNSTATQTESRKFGQKTCSDTIAGPTGAIGMLSDETMG